MRASSVLSEAGRNLRSGTTRALLLAVVHVALIGALAVVDVMSVVGVLRGAQDYREAGASVHTLAQRSPDIDGTRCEAVASAAGVTAAGAIRSAGDKRALAIPSTQFTLWEVSPAFLDVLAAGPSRATAEVDSDGSAASGIWLSADLAEALGAQAGSTVATTEGDARVAGVYAWPSDGRDRGLGYAALAPVPAAGSFTACWAETWPPDDALSGLLFTASTAGADAAKDAKLSRVNTTLGQSYDTEALLAGRLTRSAPLVALALGLALGWAATRARRLEIAGALHARIPKAHLLWQHVLETAAWVTAAALIGTAITGWFSIAGNPDPGDVTWLVGLSTIAAGSLGVVLGSLFAAALSRERHLFRYFKDR